MKGQAAPPPPEHSGGGDIASAITATLLAGPILWGLIGFGVDTWLGTGFFVPVGLVIGFLLSFYIVYLRYGRD